MDDFNPEWELIVTLPDDVIKHITRLSATRSRDIPATAWEMFFNLMLEVAEITKLPVLKATISESIYHEVKDIILPEITPTRENTIRFESNPVWLRHLREASNLLLCHQPESKTNSHRHVAAKLFVKNERRLKDLLQPHDR